MKKQCQCMKHTNIYTHSQDQCTNTATKLVYVHGSKIELCEQCLKHWFDIEKVEELC